MNPSTPQPEPHDSDDPASARCPRCRRVFDCGARNRRPDRSACWCASMPALPAEALKAGSGCLCPECLADQIARSKTGAAQ